MRFPLLSTAIVVISTVTELTNAQVNFTTNWNPLGEGCVDTAGYLSCYKNQSAKASTCESVCAASSKVGSSEYNTCNIACETEWLGDNVGCWIESCWNQVYSCAYQLTALSYFDGVGLAQSNAIPFYPPPGDAVDGACSCNLGYVYGNLSAISTNTQGSSCGIIAGDSNSTTYYDCECCALSWPISNILTACPTTDLSGIYFDNGISFPTYITNVQKLLAPSTNKCAITDDSSATCVSDYNFPYINNASINVLDIDANSPNRSQPLTNNAGNAFTVFPSASLNLTFTLAPSYTSTITPAAFNSASASANPQSVSGTVVYGGTTTSSSSMTASATSAASAAATTTKSAGVRIEGRGMLTVFGVLLGVVSVC